MLYYLYSPKEASPYEQWTLLIFPFKKFSSFKYLAFSNLLTSEFGELVILHACFATKLRSSVLLWLALSAPTSSVYVLSRFFFAPLESC